MSPAMCSSAAPGFTITAVVSPLDGVLRWGLTHLESGRRLNLTGDR